MAQAPSRRQVVQLVLPGTNGPFHRIRAVDKRRDNGSFLEGIAEDLKTVRTFIKAHNADPKNLPSSARKLIIFGDGRSKVSVKQAKRAISQAAKEAGPEGNLCVHYTGHGEEGTGNWCFEDSETLSLSDVVQAAALEGGCLRQLFISADCCHSGHWSLAVENLRVKGWPLMEVQVRAACAPQDTTLDTPRGGLFTLKLFRLRRLHDEEYVKHTTWAGCRGEKPWLNAGFVPVQKRQ